MPRPPPSSRRREAGFSLLELLVVLAIVAIVFAIAATSGRAFVQRASERSVVNTFQQAVWQGATAAASRGFETELVLAGDTFLVRRASTGAVLRSFDVDRNAETNLTDGRLLVFTPPGAVDEATLDALPDPIEIVAAGRTYALEVSLIGEVRVR